jgi:addiction module RelE/StbE family toxin
MKLEWTEPSLLDMENLRDYIAKDSEYYAARFIARIIEAAESLQQFPLVGRVVPEAEDETIRELLFQNYRIMYRVETNRVLILTVIHGSRNIEQVQPKPWDVL